MFHLLNLWMRKPRPSESESYSVVSYSLRPHELWNSPGKNTGVGSLSLLQGVFPTQGSNPGLPYCRWILYQLNHQGSQRILEWVACPLQWILPDPGITNWHLRHCRRILSQLSHQEEPGGGAGGRGLHFWSLFAVQVPWTGLESHQVNIWGHHPLSWRFLG